MSDKCSYEGCDREVYAGRDKCIFHAEKETKQELQDFHTDFRRIVDQYEHNRVRTRNFRGFVFPDHKEAGEQPIHLGSMAYNGNVDFGGSIFRGEVSFTGATFRGTADFAKAIFEGKAYFKGVTFEHWAGFELATFLGGASFEGATFHSEAFFHLARFRVCAWFWSVVFAETAQFEGSAFLGKVKFSWPGGPRRPPGKPLDPPIMPGTIHFKEIECPNGGVLGFSNNDLREGCRVIFEECDLSRTKFAGTDCRKIDFINCTWADCGGRDGVGDEFLVRFEGKNWWQRILSETPRVRIPGGDWRRIAITYNELASNYSDKLDYPHSHYFDAGVMVMRLLDCVPEHGWRKWLWDKGKPFQWLLAMQHRNLSFIAFYRYLTAYGNRYLRPLVWLFGLSFGFGLLYYKFIGSLCFGQAMRLSLAVATLNRTGMAEAFNHNIFLDAIASFQIILTATLVALFLLALRRRFKR